jgi:hypothetical protein
MSLEMTIIGKIQPEANGNCNEERYLAWHNNCFIFIDPKGGSNE